MAADAAAPHPLSLSPVGERGCVVKGLAKNHANLSTPSKAGRYSSAIPGLGRRELSHLRPGMSGACPGEGADTPERWQGGADGLKALHARPEYRRAWKRGREGPGKLRVRDVTDVTLVITGYRHRPASRTHSPSRQAAAPWRAWSRPWSGMPCV